MTVHHINNVVLTISQDNLTFVASLGSETIGTYTIADPNDINDINDQTDWENEIIEQVVSIQS